jgi:hypothetical protein
MCSESCYRVACGFSWPRASTKDVDGQTFMRIGISSRKLRPLLRISEAPDSNISLGDRLFRLMSFFFPESILVNARIAIRPRRLLRHPFVVIIQATEIVVSRSMNT